ncbi:MAG: alanine racemase [Peptococcaceae bacterium]|jgi:alanine racemase|nr:alanine racemase [Peptococcaceae bacterium]
MPDLWIEIDLDAVKHNYRQIKSKLCAESSLMAVVKADGYGLGAVPVAQALEEEGCCAFAVTRVEEALLLREHGIEGEILVLGPSDPEEWPQALAKKIDLTVSRLERIAALNDTARELEVKAGIHLKLETGMGRTGFTREMLPALAQSLKESSYLNLRGVYTHLARGAQRDKVYTYRQHQRFIEYISILEENGINIPRRHICNSAGLLDFPEYHYELVRSGTLLCGHFPSPAFFGKLDLKDPWTVKAKIVHLQRVPKGTFVGYQSVYKCKKDTTLAVIGVGHADGFGLEPKFVPQGLLDLIKIIIKNIAALFGLQLGRDKLLFKDKQVRIAGKIGMQLTVIDMGDIECQLGDEIVVPLRRTLANPRIPRIYKKNGVICTKRVIKEGILSINQE